MGVMWYYSVKGKAVGPVTGEVLKQVASASGLGPNDMVRREDTKDWVPAHRVSG